MAGWDVAEGDKAKTPDELESAAAAAEQRAAELETPAGEWLRELFPDRMTGVDESTRAAIEALHWSMALRVLGIGTNVVLDYGLWGHSERDRFRSEAQALGARVVLCLVDPPRDELIARVARRNATLPAGAFHITDEVLDRALATFQRPTPEELALFDDVIGA